MSGKVCLVLLHGSGSCGYDVAGYLNSVPIPEFKYNTFHDTAARHSIDILTPTADRRRYSAVGGERCNVWFDRTESFMRKGLSDSEDLEGAEYSLNKVLSIIETVESKYDHVFIGGFSMGGGLALHTLRKDQPAKLRGIFTMGSFLVQDSAVVTGPLGQASKVPLLMMHGESDSMIRCEWGRQTASNLLLRGVDVQFRSYRNVDHEMDTSELADLLDWVRHILDLHKQKQQQLELQLQGDAKESATSPAAGDKAAEGSKSCAHSNLNLNTSTTCTAHSSSAAEAKDTEHSFNSPVRDAKHDGFHREAKAAASEDKREGHTGTEEEQMDVVEREIASSAALLSSDRDVRLQQQSQHSSTNPFSSSTAGDRVSASSGSGKDHSEVDAAAQARAQEAGMLIPYTVEYLTVNSGGSGSSGVSKTTAAAPSARLRYTVPRDLVPVLTARPVLACGSMFEILPDSPVGVQVLLQSSDPHSTAVQIGLRLQNRISSGGASLNACPMS